MNENTSPEGVFDPAIEQVNKIMAGPMNFYNAERVENEIDLIAEVRQRMVSVGLADRLPDCFDSNRFILEAQGKPAHAQQYNLNRYFTTQFMAVPEDTTLQRYASIYEIRPDQWLDIFDNTILPGVVNFNLPVAL